VVGEVRPTGGTAAEGTRHDALGRRARVRNGPAASRRTHVECNNRNRLTLCPYGETTLTITPNPTRERARTTRQLETHLIVRYHGGDFWGVLLALWAERTRAAWSACSSATRSPSDVAAVPWVATLPKVASVRVWRPWAWRGVGALGGGDGDGVGRRQCPIVSFGPRGAGDSAGDARLGGDGGAATFTTSADATETLIRSFLWRVVCRLVFGNSFRALLSSSSTIASSCDHDSAASILLLKTKLRKATATTKVWHCAKSAAIYQGGKLCSSGTQRSQSATYNKSNAGKCTFCAARWKENREGDHRLMCCWVSSRLITYGSSLCPIN
jgi:hypothetical protein